jgi:hypothetical protein
LAGRGYELNDALHEVGLSLEQVHADPELMQDFLRRYRTFTAKVRHRLLTAALQSTDSRVLALAVEARVAGEAALVAAVPGGEAAAEARADALRRKLMGEILKNREAQRTPPLQPQPPQPVDQLQVLNQQAPIEHDKALVKPVQGEVLPPKRKTYSVEEGYRRPDGCPEGTYPASRSSNRVDWTSSPWSVWPNW